MAHFTVNTVGNGADVWEKTIANIAQTDQGITDNPEVLIKVSTTADIRARKREGKLAILYGTQDTSLVGADLDRLALSGGWESVAFNLPTICATSAATARSNPAMPALQARVGDHRSDREEKMLVDFSHGGQRTIAEGIAATTRPPIISHTGCRALHDNPRNVGTPR